MTTHNAQHARTTVETAATARSAPRPTVRRLLVTFGVVASLVAAGATIRAASLWAAGQAPLTVAPVSVESVRLALEQEQSRSAALEEQIASLQASAAELEAALASAGDRLVTDQATADELRASLAAAQEKLAKLEAALAAAAKTPARTSTRSTTTTSYEDDDGEDEEDDHDEGFEDDGTVRD
jgi:septal ring factor EnvC (AmiA/AmiB activator)